MLYIFVVCIGTKICWVLTEAIFPTLPQVVALLASVHVVHRLTAPTPNVTAPDELTLAALYMSYHVCVVAPPTAEQVAAVRPD